jgi:hypothetical protein
MLSIKGVSTFPGNSGHVKPITAGLMFLFDVAPEGV